MKENSYLRADDMLRKCRKCGLEAHTNEELELFVNKKKAKHGKAQLCKKCNQDITKDWTLKNREKYLEWRKDRKKKGLDSGIKANCDNIYFCTVDEYYTRMKTSSICEVCGTKENLCYDHCHDTLEFRGVLCKKCNTGIGMLGDTLDSLKKAVAYLSR